MTDLGKTSPIRLSWVRIFTGVAAVLAVILVEPYEYSLKVYSIPLIVVVGVIGFFTRRSLFDAGFYVAAHLLCMFAVEPVAAPQMLAFLSLSLLTLSGRPRFALLMSGSLMALLLFSVQMKRRFAGSPLTWQDLHYFFLQFKDNVGVMASQPTLLIYAIAALLALIFSAVLFWKLDAKDSASGRPHVLPGYSRALPLLIALWCAYALNADAVLSSRKSAWSFSEHTNSIPISTFLSTLYMEPKAQYHKVDTTQFVQNVNAVKVRVDKHAQPADIIVFLQESQFNPLSIDGCPASLCSLKIFDSTAGTTDRGELRVHTYGGGTWLSEFAFTSGLPHQVYGPAGDFASFNVAPGVNRSFIRSLKAAGYYTVAVYPVRGGMMNGRMAYRSYGFDEFYDSDDLGLPGRFDTPDSSIHEAAVKIFRLAQARGKPVFLLALTIFNHAEHGIRMERVAPDAVAAAQKVFNKHSEAQSLADYMWRTRQFEMAYQKTREIVFGSARPCVLAWFGDHQPPFGNAPELRSRIGGAAAGSGTPNRYLTWYDIAVNTPQAGTASRPQQLDIVFLPGLLAQRAGVPLDDWLAANVLAREHCDGLLFECHEAKWRDGYLSYLLGDLQSIH